MISVDDYLALYASAGWGAIPPEQAQAGINGSAYVVAAKDEASVVGTARLLLDGGSAALIKDVIVFPEYQGRGIGRTMMEQLIEYLRSRLKPGWRVLVDLSATPGKEGFYQKFGFAIRPNTNFGNGMVMRLIK
ncbi:MAG: GNAT family N-acetyltransferase [Oscillospiraceae bacterium]|jgi:GNAT superfamily N-acetyltransferase|nr:GNAT family N-acetyltransferase [Oscillospiraceae bacterium]